MITFIILALILIATCLVGGFALGGAAIVFGIVFGDLIACILLIVVIVKLCKKKR